MTSKEIIRRVVRHNAPPRLGWDFLDPRYQDLKGMRASRFVHPSAEPYQEWGEYEALRRETGFHGELRMDPLGNIYGRLNGMTKGECIRGALEEGWEALDNYVFPKLEPVQAVLDAEKYMLAGMPIGLFSALRDVRRIDNALMDTAAEPELVTEFLERLLGVLVPAVGMAADAGAHGIIIYDDWGMQHSPFISPASFRELFQPAYARIAAACHARDIDFMLHSCGYVLPLVDDMIDAGVDVFQFDQPEAAGSDLWARDYGRKVAFYSPVDIQKVMATGDRAFIEDTALKMTERFKACGGSLIAKDYPTPQDIEVKREWCTWAMDVIVKNSGM